MDVLVGCFISLYGLFDFDVQNPTQRKNLETFPPTSISKIVAINGVKTSRFERSKPIIKSFFPVSFMGIVDFPKSDGTNWDFIKI